MSIPYSIKQRVKPGDPTAPRKFYAIGQSDGEISLRELVNEIAEISTVSTIDSLAVLESLLKVMPKHLKNGRIIRLGEFGSFRVTISSEGAETEDEFSKKLIKNAKLKFNPGKEISKELKTVDYVKA